MMGLSLRQLRTLRGSTQQDTAHAADISIRCLQMLEAGHIRQPNRRTLRGLARALEIDQALLAASFRNDNADVESAGEVQTGAGDDTARTPSH